MNWRGALGDAISKRRQDIHGELDNFRKDFSDTFAALRGEVNVSSLIATGHFVRRDSFSEVIKGFQDTVTGALTSSNSSSTGRSRGRFSKAWDAPCEIVRHCFCATGRMGVVRSPIVPYMCLI